MLLFCLVTPVYASDLQEGTDVQYFTLSDPKYGFTVTIPGYWEKEDEEVNDLETIIKGRYLYVSDDHVAEVSFGVQSAEKLYNMPSLKINMDNFGFDAFSEEDLEIFRQVDTSFPGFTSTEENQYVTINDNKYLKIVGILEQNYDEIIIQYNYMMYCTIIKGYGYYFYYADMSDDYSVQQTYSDFLNMIKSTQYTIDTIQKTSEKSTLSNAKDTETQKPTSNHTVTVEDNIQPISDNTDGSNFFYGITVIIAVFAVIGGVVTIVYILSKKNRNTKNKITSNFSSFYEREKYKQYKYDHPSNKIGILTYTEYSKFGGWLLIFGIGRVISVILIIYVIHSDVIYIEMINKSLFPALYWAIWTVIMINIITTILEGSILFLFSRKPKNYIYIKKILIIMFVLGMIGSIVLYINTGYIDYTYTNYLIQPIKFFVIWYTYFRKSVRVKCYFKLVTPSVDEEPEGEVQDDSEEFSEAPKMKEDRKHTYTQKQEPEIKSNTNSSNASTQDTEYRTVGIKIHINNIKNVCETLMNDFDILSVNGLSEPFHEYILAAINNYREKIPHDNPDIDYRKFSYAVIASEIFKLIGSGNYHTKIGSLTSEGNAI